jgi:hypothetical protein
LTDAHAIDRETPKGTSRRLSFPKPFAERYWLPFDHAAHPDAENGGSLVFSSR